MLGQEDVVKRLVELDERATLDSEPEVKAMREVVRLKPHIDRDSVARLCVAAGLNDFQQRIAANPDENSFWGRFVHWTLADGEGDPPWRRFQNLKARRFERFRNSRLWQAKLLEMDSGRIRASLAEIMEQPPQAKTICFAPLVLARWAYVLGRPFTVVSDHPLPIDSRISRFLESSPGLDPHRAMQEANEARRKLGRRDLNMSDFDAWAWQNGA